MGPGDRRLVAVAGYLHGLSHGNILAIPVFLTVWSEFAADDVARGLLAASAYACFGLSSVPFGFLADRRGARALLAVCAGGIATALAAIAVSPSLPFLAVSLAALGLFSGIYHPTGLALISRRVRETGRGFGWHGMGGSLGVALGPAAVGGLLALGWSWRWVAGILVAPPILGVALVLATRTGAEGPVPVDPKRVGPARGLRTATFGLILLVYMFAGLAYWGSLTFLPRFVGTGSFVFLLALGAIGQVLSGRFADRERSERILLGLSLVAGLLLVVLALEPSNPLIPAAWAYGFLLFSLEPLQNTLVTREVPRDTRGAAFGMTFLAVFGLGSAGSALAGLLLAGGAPAVLFLALGAFLAMSGLCAFAAGRAQAVRRRGPDSPP